MDKTHCAPVGMLLFSWKATKFQQHVMCWLMIAAISVSSSQLQSCGLKEQGVAESSNFHFLFLTDEYEDCFGNSTSELVRKVEELILHMSGSHLQLKIGLQVVPACDGPYHSAMRVSRLVTSQIPDHQSCQVLQFNSTLIGVIGPSNPIIAKEISDTIYKTEIPYISYGEFVNPGSSNDSIRHTNTFYSGVSLNTRAKAIAELAVELNWDLVTVVHDDDDLNSNLVPLVLEALNKEHICYKEVIINSNGDIDVRSDAPHGLIMLGSNRNIQAAINRSTQSHTWITSSPPSDPVQLVVPQAGQMVYSIAVPPTADNEAAPKIYSASAALISATEAFKSVFKLTCEDSVHACTMMDRALLFRSISAEIEKLRLTPSSHSGPSFLDPNKLGVLEYQDGMRLAQGENDPDIKVFGATSFQANQSPLKIGNYFNMQGWDNTNIAGSRSWCLDKGCQASCADQIPPKEYIFIPGDFIVVATAPIHVKKHKFPDQLSCYKFGTAFSLRAEAAVYARDRLQEHMGLNLGILMFDTCYSSAKAQKYLIDIFNGTTKYCNNKGTCLDRTKIVAILGDYSSHVSIDEQHVSVPQNMLQLAWGAATSKLDDKTDYPFFLRVHPTQTRITRDMVQVLDKLTELGKVDTHSVVLLSTRSNYGTAGRELLHTFLRESGYCVSHDIILNQDDNVVKELVGGESWTDESKAYLELWSSLRNQKHVFIYNGDEDPLIRLLDVMRNDSGLSKWWKDDGNFFIFAEGWDDRPELLTRYGNLFEGSISFKLNQTFEITGFIDHIQEANNVKQPSLNDENPWYIRMYQIEQRCKFRGDFTTDSDTACVTKPYKEKEDRDILEIYNVYLMKALYTLAYSLKIICNDDFDNCNQVFERTRANTERFRNITRDILIPASDALDDNYPALKPIDSAGDGNAGYIVYQQQSFNPQSPETEYIHIFSFFKRAPSTPDLIQPHPSRNVVFPNPNRNGHINTVIIECDMQRCACPEETTAKSEISTQPSQINSSLWIVIGVLCFLLMLILLYLIIHTLKKRRENLVRLPCWSSADCKRSKEREETPGEDHAPKEPVALQQESQQQRDTEEINNQPSQPSACHVNPAYTDDRSLSLSDVLSTGASPSSTIPVPVFPEIESEQPAPSARPKPKPRTMSGENHVTTLPSIAVIPSNDNLENSRLPSVDPLTMTADDDEREYIF